MARGILDEDEARARLYEAMRADRPLPARLERALEIGKEYFGVDHAYITEIDRESGEWEVIISTDAADGAIPEGRQLDLETTYCWRTIREEAVVAFDDVFDGGWTEDSVEYRTAGFRCYHGAPIIVDDATYGTVCFLSDDAREEPFTEAEKSFSHLIARMAGYEIELDRYERDLSERERELEERREIYRAVIEASFDLVFRIDTDGLFTYVSAPIEELLGYAPEKYVGEPFTSMLPDDETVELAGEVFERVLEGETVEEQYFPLETADGGRVYVDVRVTPIYDAEPAERTVADIVAVQGVARDATERRRRERLIRVLNRVLRHNLRNDMNVVLGIADSLADELDGEPSGDARRIADTAGRLLELGETARELEQNVQTPPELEPLDVVPLVTDAAEGAEERYPGATVTVDAPESAVARAAPRLATAVTELLDNAAKHAGEAPTVDVTVAVGDDRVTVDVADDGPGLPDQERMVLVSGEETSLAHGSGLGLWLVYWIVTSLGGAIEVPERDAGTTISMRLRRT